MNYVKTLESCKQDLLTYTLRDLDILAKFYKVKSANVNNLVSQLCSKILAEQIPKYAQMTIGEDAKCRNTVETITQDTDIDDDKFIRDHNGICWDVENLANYIISNGGINEHKHDIENLNVKNKPIYNDADLLSIANKLINLDNTTLVDQFRQSVYTNVDLLTPGLMNNIRKTGAILQARGPLFNEEINKKWSPELINEWNRARHNQELYEPPRNLSLQLSDELHALKEDVFRDFYNVYTTQSDNIRDKLTELYPGLTPARLEQCNIGEYCMKIVGSVLLDTFNKWANLTGREPYIYRRETTMLDDEELARAIISRRGLPPSLPQLRRDGLFDEQTGGAHFSEFPDQIQSFDEGTRVSLLGRSGTSYSDGRTVWDDENEDDGVRRRLF
jgi:hypothetical protein